MNKDTQEFLKQFQSPDGSFHGDYCVRPIKPCKCVECGAVTTPDGESYEYVCAVYGPESIDTESIKTEADFIASVTGADTACWQCHSDQVETLISQRSIMAAHWLGLCDFDGNQYPGSEA